MFKMSISQLLILSLLGVYASGCTNNCEECTITQKAGEIINTCNLCQSGYNLNGNNCQIDLAALIAIVISGFVVISSQAIVYILCKLKYRQITKKPTEVNLQDIYKSDDEGQGSQQQQQERQSDSMKTQYKIYVKNKCGVCHKQETSIKTACGHYFHHNCFKDNIQATPDLCPKCTKRGISPIDIICTCCLNKKRQIPLQSISSFQNFKQYYCVICKMKMKNEEEEKKWWKKYFN